MKPSCANLTFLIYATILVMGPAAAAQTPSYQRTAETNAFNELVLRLEEKNINFTERSLMADYGAFGMSVEVNIPAQPDSGGGDDLFVLAVPILDVQDEYPFNGTEDRLAGGSLGWCVELALGLIDKFLSEPQPFGTLVYFAADNWPATGGGAAPYAGFQALLDDLQDREGAVIVYCNSSVTVGESPLALSILRGTGAASTPLALVEPFIQLCMDDGIPCFFDSKSGGTPDAAGSLDGADEIQIIYVTGVSPARFATTPSAAMAGKEIKADEAAALLCLYAEEIFRGGINSDEADRNYAYINHKNKVIFFPELTLVLLTLFGMTSLSVLCFCLYYAGKSRYKRVLIPVFVGFILLTASFLFVLHTNGGQNLPVLTESPAPQVKITEVNLDSEAIAFTYFTANLESTRFLDHRIVKIEIEARLPPLRYSLFFTDQSADDPAYFIYDAPMPYSSDGKRIEFILGSYPPNPLNIELALPLGLNGEFSIEGFFPGNVAVSKTFTVPDND
ncbi:MAG: hypothetical protein LBD44_04050 [Spirochaetaceae bacterium]|nr:hypothetical protein [Spirochaetaceae bacterium]